MKVGTRFRSSKYIGEQYEIIHINPSSDSVVMTRLSNNTSFGGVWSILQNQFRNGEYKITNGYVKTY